MRCDYELLPVTPLEEREYVYTQISSVLHDLCMHPQISLCASFSRPSEEACTEDGAETFSISLRQWTLLVNAAMPGIDTVESVTVTEAEDASYVN